MMEKDVDQLDLPWKKCKSIT